MKLKNIEKNRNLRFFLFKKFLSKNKYVPKNLNNLKYFFLFLSICFFYKNFSANRKRLFLETYKFYNYIFQKKNIEEVLKEERILNLFIFLEKDLIKKIYYFIEFNIKKEKKINGNNFKKDFINISHNSEKILFFLKKNFPESFNIIYKKIIFILFNEKRK